jgi:hypothetical protein
MLADVAYWHFSAVPAAPNNVRFQGSSSRAAEISRRQSLTRCGNRVGQNAVMHNTAFSIMW